MTAINENDTGDVVEKWQTFLCGLGLLESVSGTYDADTVLATKAYQKSNRLSQNGTVDNATMIVAIQSGLPSDSGGYPIKPSFLEPYSKAEADEIFGVIKYRPAPLPNNKENIVITNNWSKDNVVQIKIPQLIKLVNGGNIYWHKNGVDNIMSLFQNWDDADLMPFVLTWGGSWVPRLVRGSTTSLSNHSRATAFDINVKWNYLGQNPAKRGQEGSVVDLINIATTNGFFWGYWFGQAPYGTRTDGMHFELAKKSD